MGIKDLLKFMKPHVETIHIKKYAGKRVGIDGYSWLHKGAYSCSMELCLNMEGDKKFQYLNYFMHRINLLRHYKITPVVVFDGQNIPCKAATEHERTRRRKANRDLAMAKLKEGNVTAATELFQRAVSISPSMAHQLIQILRSEDIDYVVAPYEADAQLAYLSSLETEKGGIVGVISEDSDLLAYGCPSIIFKMDRFGNGEEIVLSKAFESMDRVPSFRSFNMELFTGMCVLAGCDFLSSVPGIGIVKAYSLVSKYRNLDRALSILRFEKGNIMPEDYIKSFREALAVFQHALVYDSNSKSLKHIKPLPEKLLQSLDANLNFLGPEIPQSIAAAIAEGNLDPSTMEAFDQYPSSKIHLRSSTISQISSRPLKLEATAIAKEDSCFSVITSHRAKKEKTTMMKRKPVKEEPKYLNEVTVLEKLVCPLTTPPTEENKKCTEKVLLKVPENNPFKRKLEEVQLNEMERITEEVSMSAEAEDWEVLCITPESQQSVNSKLIYGIKKAKTEKSNSSITQNKESKKSSILNFFQRV